jgi:tetratricopeptide (TPR) repeat protein
MLELLVAVGLISLSRITISDIISVSSLAKGLISRIGEKDAIGILKKAIDKTAVEAEEAEIKEILIGLKGKEELLHEFRAVNEEAKRELVSKYFKGRKDILEQLQLAKNYYELFCREATKKDRPFREFVVIELGKLANQGVIADEAVKRVEIHLEGIESETSKIKVDTTEIKAGVSRIEGELSKLEFFTCPIGEQREFIKKIKTSWLRRFFAPFENALKLQNSSDYSKAIEIFSEILKDIERERAVHRCDENFIIEHEVNSIETLCFFNLGVNLQYLKKHPKAIAFYEKSIFLAERFGFEDDFIAGNYNNRGSNYHELKQYERAIEDYSRAMELNPKCATAYTNRGVTYAKLKQHEKAIGDYNKAIEMNPEYADAYNNRGLSYAKLKQHEKAIEDYGKAIEMNPNFAKPYNNRSITYHELRQYETAIEDCSKAIELNPKYAKAYYNRGNAYYELNQYERAIEDYSKAIELNPNFAEAYINRGIGYRKSKQHEMAIEDFNRGIKLMELDPELALAYIYRGEAYLGLNQYEMAIEDYNKAIELKEDLPDNGAMAYNGRGYAYVALKQYNKALEDFNKAIELDPNPAVVYYNRGNAYYELNQYERAIVDYDKAIELNPKYAEAYGNRGIAHSKIGRYEESARDFKKAGILFFNSGGVDYSVKVYSFCFDLRAKIENEDVIYSGLALFLITLNPDIIIALRRMRIADENLRKIHKFTLKKLQNEDISEDIAALEREDGRKEMKILLELLKYI